METISLLGVLFSFIAFIVGMINPKLIKSKSRKTVALVCPLLFLMFVLLVPKDTIKETESPTQTTEKEKVEPSKEQQEEASSEEINSSIGKPIQIGYFIYTVQSISFRKTVGNEYVEETADGIYMLINLSIKNISDETRTLDGSLFAVTDQNGTKYEFSTNASTALELSGKKTLFLKECQPNITTKGVLIFEVPEKGEYYLHLIGSFWGVNSVKILLK